MSEVSFCLDASIDERFLLLLGFQEQRFRVRSFRGRPRRWRLSKEKRESPESQTHHSKRQEASNLFCRRFPKQAVIRTQTTEQSDLTPSREEGIDSRHTFVSH